MCERASHVNRYPAEHLFLQYSSQFFSQRGSLGAHLIYQGYAIMIHGILLMQQRAKKSIMLYRHSDKIL
jgi:hypothetical protein